MVSNYAAKMHFNFRIFLEDVCVGNESFITWWIEEMRYEAMLQFSYLLSSISTKRVLIHHISGLRGSTCNINSLTWDTGGANPRKDYGNYKAMIGVDVRRNIVPSYRLTKINVR